MKTAALITTSFFLCGVASVALTVAAPDLEYGSRMLILLSAYFSGAAARSVRP